MKSDKINFETRPSKRINVDWKTDKIIDDAHFFVKNRIIEEFDLENQSRKNHPDWSEILATLHEIWIGRGLYYIVPHWIKEATRNKLLKLYGTDKPKPRKCDKPTRKECHICTWSLNLEVHHIIPKHIGGTELPSNKITLCPNCHKQVHQKLRELAKGRDRPAKFREEYYRSAIHLAREEIENEIESVSERRKRRPFLLPY